VSYQVNVQCARSWDRSVLGERGASVREDTAGGRAWARRSCALILSLSVTPLFALEPQVSDSRFDAQRQEMVEHQIARRGVDDARVLAAMRTVPRHLFVPEDQRLEAYVDHPLPIGGGQTISQPYIVGLMTSLLELDGSERVLEIGTGSGYQAAVLGELAAEVYTIEIRESLGRQAGELLERLGYRNVHVRVGNGYRGWPEEAPFDAIIVTASPPDIPPELVEQLKIGGRMVVPVGGGAVQDLELLTKSASGVVRKDIVPVRFVPMIGEQD
jgi:protein-L-isoaspartate(D-aspartate) O-methyltransferase